MIDAFVFLDSNWWTEPLGTWMAWTRATIMFFLTIPLLIALIGLWSYLRPEGLPRRGILTLKTTRGDRLFLSLLGSAFIALGWLFFFGTPIMPAIAPALLWTIFVFRLI